MPRSNARVIGVSSLLGSIDDIQERWLGSVTYTVGTNIEYSLYVEYGTSRMAAQPYLRPAAAHVRRNLDRWAESANSIEALVEQAALELEAYAKSTAPVDTGTLRASIEARKADGAVAASQSIQV